MNDVVSDAGDAAAVRSANTWRPAISATELAIESSVALGFIEEEELAVWRAPDGTVQAWENRCPHRGMRFTLGRIVDDRLSCAYHGWEFQAGSGRCSAIPAHPTMPVPRNICARTFPAREADGIVWVSRQPTVEPPPATGANRILRSLGVRVPAQFLVPALLEAGWQSSDQQVFKKETLGYQTVACLTRAGKALSVLHVGVIGELDENQGALLHARLRQLRTDVEASWQFEPDRPQGEQQ